MNWSDEGLVLSTRRYGENSLIVNLLTIKHGRHSGLVRAGSSTRNRGLYQPGNHLCVEWKGRLAEHLGTFTGELVKSNAAVFFNDRLPLMALCSATAILDVALPEREPVPELFAELNQLIKSLEKTGWAILYLRWEMSLLGQLGFGLDLTECAATGSKQDLIYVSPKSGRSVSATAGEKFRKKLLDLPTFLLSDDEHEVDGTCLSKGFTLTGYFLARHVMNDANQKLPAARIRLAEFFAQRSFQTFG